MYGTGSYTWPSMLNSKCRTEIFKFKFKWNNCIYLNSDSNEDKTPSEYSSGIDKCHHASIVKTTLLLTDSRTQDLFSTQVWTWMVLKNNDLIPCWSAQFNYHVRILLSFSLEIVQYINQTLPKLPVLIVLLINFAVHTADIFHNILLLYAFAIFYCWVWRNLKMVGENSCNTGHISCFWKTFPQSPI